MAQPNVEQLLIQARAAQAKGDVKAAQALVKQILTLDGRNVEAWLLATYLTSNPDQQRLAINRAKQFAPGSVSVLRREEELFPTGNTFVPDDPSLPPMPLPPLKRSTSAQPQPAQAQASPQEPPVVVRQTTLALRKAKVGGETTGDHIPTLADGVAFQPTFRLAAYLPLGLAVGVIALCAVLGIGYNALNQNALQNSPSGVVMRFYPALEAGDNATLGTILGDEARALCGDDLVACLRPRANLGDLQGATLGQESQSGLSASVQVVLHARNNTTLCQTFYTQSVSGSWKIIRDDTPVSCSESQQAPQGAIGASDQTQVAVAATSTLLAQTQGAMQMGPTLTATYLAPSFTETALSGHADDLNTAIASTATQAVVAVTQTARSAGETTSTPLAQTQIAASATGAAMTFTSTLKGSLAVAKTIQGHPTLVLLSADGKSVKSLNLVGNNPAWSRDGKQIVYTNREHQPSIHVAGADGSNDHEIPIPDAPFGSDWATWTTDGHQLLVEGGTRMGLHTVFAVSLDNGKVTQVIDDSRSGGWNSQSPDSRLILYTKDDQVWVVSVEGGSPRSLATQAGARAATWSPDNKEIAFDAGDDNDRGIYIMAADGSALKRITPSSVYVGMPAWSPDGTQIAALCFDPHAHNNQVCVMAADGTHLTTLTADGAFDGRISWTR